jgi:hypothetical protein
VIQEISAKMMVICLRYEKVFFDTLIISLFFVVEVPGIPVK